MSDSNPLESIEITTHTGLVIQMSIVLDALMAVPREFNPLEQTHPAVEERMKCPVCYEVFQAGAVTVLIPVAPADAEEDRKWREQRAYTARAELIHARCVRPLIEEIARYVQERDQSHTSHIAASDAHQDTLPPGHPETGDDRIHDQRPGSAGNGE